MIKVYIKIYYYTSKLGYWEVLHCSGYWTSGYFILLPTDHRLIGTHYQHSGVHSSPRGLTAMYTYSPQILPTILIKIRIQGDRTKLYFIICLFLRLGFKIPQILCLCLSHVLVNLSRRWFSPLHSSI